MKNTEQIIKPEHHAILEALVYGSNTNDVNEALAFIEKNNQWNELCDMLNDPRMYQQDGNLITKDNVLEITNHYENITVKQLEERL